MESEKLRATTETLKFLIELQGLLGKYFRLHTDYKKASAVLTDKQDQLQAHEQNLKEAQARKDSLTKEIQSLHQDIEDAREHIKGLKEKEIRVQTQREYLALSEEEENYQAKIKEKTTQHNQLTHELEALSQQIGKHHEHCLQYREEIAMLHNQHEPCIQKLKTQEQEIQKLKKEGRSTEVDFQTVQYFEQVLENKSGVGIVQVANGICEGCNMKIAPQILAQIYQGDRVVSCINCSRILYVSKRLAAPKSKLY